MQTLKRSQYLIPQELVSERDVVDFMRFKTDPRTREAYPVYLLQPYDATHFSLPRALPLRERWAKSIKDETIFAPMRHPLMSTFDLWPHQQEAFDLFISRVTKGLNEGTLKMPTGSGKTRTAFKIMERLNQVTCVIVPTKALLKQWVLDFKEIYGREPGVYYSDAKVLDNDVVIMLTNSAHAIPEQYLNRFGFLVVDEGHHVGSTEWSTIVTKFGARYRLQISATPERSADGGHEVTFAHFGSIFHEVPSTQTDAAGFTRKVGVIVYRYPVDMAVMRWGGKNFDSTETLTRMAADVERNRFLCDIIRANDVKCRNTLTITTRLEMIWNMQSELARDDIQLGALVAKTDAQEVLKLRHVAGIQSLVKQGLDKKTLETGLMGTPFSNREMLIQFRGRMAREAEKQDPYLVDVVDSEVPLEDLVLDKTSFKFKHRRAMTPLELMFLKRLEVYKEFDSDITFVENGRRTRYAYR